jgi:asparagine synthase (glutamine-hydrolysing)
MCGIAGIASLGKQPSIDPFWAKRMADTLRHRGPDDEGFATFTEDSFHCFGGNDTPSEVFESQFPFSPNAPHTTHHAPLLLAHRRLSIQDVSPAGHQPMCDTSTRFWIVFNGEVYNYLEIGSELKTLGHSFVSHSDTEVVLHAYMQWGKNCIQKFNGMWAFVIYDHHENTLFCSRDRFGVKPFYYFLSEHFFAFASEQKALITLPFLQKKLDEEAVYDYLVLGETEREEQGFFENILELLPSHRLSVNLNTGKVQKERYFTLNHSPEFGSFNATTSSRHVAKIKDLLAESVRLRLRSDVPVGACLSGGIDSSSVVCLANQQRQSPSPFHVFTASYPGLEIDESAWAKVVVEATNTQWHTIETKAEDLLQQYETLVYAQDIPFLGSSTLSQHKVMELVQKTGIKVTLDGQGADELFSGYNRHISIHLLELARHGKLPELIHYALSNDKTSADPTLKLLIRHLAEQFAPSLSYKLLKSSNYHFSLLQPDFWQLHRERYFEQRNENLFSLNESLQQEFTGWQLKYLMRTADRNSMWHSVESRVPFADDLPLAEYLSSVPAAYKIQQGKSKYLLRESMKGILPDPIRNRLDKKGFVTPEYLWFKSLKNEIKESITDNLEPFVDTSQLKKEWDSIFDHQLANNTLGISRFLILSMWRRKFGV